MRSDTRAPEQLPLTGLDKAFAKFLQDAEPSPDARHTLLAALTSYQFGRGHACLDLDLLAQGVAVLGWDARLQALLPPGLAHAADTLPWAVGPASPLVRAGPRLYLRRNWQAEQSVRAAIQARLQQPCAVPTHLRELLDQLFPKAMLPDGADTGRQGNISKGALANPLVADAPAPNATRKAAAADLAEQGTVGAVPAKAVAGTAPTIAHAAPDWQKVACALAARSRLTLITGGPGTGKTTTVVRLLALLHAAAAHTSGTRGVGTQAVGTQVAGNPDAAARVTSPVLRVALAAPTGKAAARLSESIASAIAQLPDALRPTQVAPAVTLHKLLHIRPDQTGRATPALAVDLVIVDEASMIDLEMMARLLAAVPLSASLVLLGDKDQLASVEAGAVLAQLCEGADAGHYSAATVDWLGEVAGADVSAWSAANRVTTVAGASTDLAIGDGERVAKADGAADGAAAGPRALAQQTVTLRQSRRFRDDSGIGIWAKAVNAGDRRTVQALWLLADQQLGERAPTQDDMVQLLAQLAAMQDYSNCLTERIAAF